jgi:hypothetical protein
VFAQCQHCKVWHTLAANNPAIMEEVVYGDPAGQKARRDALFAEAKAAEAAGAAARGARRGAGKVGRRDAAAPLRPAWSPGRPAGQAPPSPGNAQRASRRVHARLTLPPPVFPHPLPPAAESDSARSSGTVEGLDGGDGGDSATSRPAV